ncbi:MAG TPA: hypothetical protein VJ914_04530 [Pseudonocardiaceae bacterium]|nr:hypothetical protein [Pseudonocardiaceae bacterium]
MTGLVLTDERREELAALLDDDQRLRSEYPKVAEYLDMAPNLPGTGNAEMDAAFDLRFVHFATGDASVSRNPYWDIVGPSVFDRAGRRHVDGGTPEGSGRLAYAQVTLQAMYAYAIPAPSTLHWAAEFCSGRPVVELGAGRGYWAYQLSQAGLQVDAYDVEPPDTAINVSFDRAAGQRDVWYPVGTVDDFASRSDGLANCVLFLCWPPGWGNPMASETLAEFTEAGGTRLIYVGEPKGGKTGNDDFFDRLSSEWELASQDDEYASWWNLNDGAQGWVRH